jgi:hypothetical protein
MVQIHKKSIRVPVESTALPYVDLMKGAIRNDCVSLLQNLEVDIAEFPAADGSVELVAEVVTMTKQDYDDILAYLVEFRNSSNGDQALLAGEVFRMLTGKSMWA